MKSSFPVDSSHKAHIHDQIFNSSANNAKIKGESRERKEIIIYVNWKYKMFQAKMNYIMRVFFSMSKRFLMGQKKKKDGKYFLLTNIIRLTNIPPISIVFPHNALSVFW